jgi:Uma2 family endonuclease
VLVHNLSWSAYLAMSEALGTAGSHARLTYLEGTLEIMSPSRRHEKVKTTIARLVEIYAVESNIDLVGFGSTTYRREARERGLEPDECYCIGDDEDKEVPDIALEVVLTSGGIDKLKVYSGLGVPEVWIWSRGKLQVYERRGDAYAPRPRSAFLPELDLDLVAELVETRGQSAAVREFRERLRK